MLLLLCSPYLLLRWACLAVYECFIGKRLVNRELCEDRKRNFKYEMAVVCISKNEGPYIREWIEFHRLVGISKFYFYDNESDDDTSDVLAPYIADGIVDYILIKGKGVQLDAYNQAIEKHKEECRYMAFLDMDEYLTPIKPFANVASLVDTIIRKAGGGGGRSRCELGHIWNGSSQKYAHWLIDNCIQYARNGRALGQFSYQDGMQSKVCRLFYFTTLPAIQNWGV